MSTKVNKAVKLQSLLVSKVVVISNQCNADLSLSVTITTCFKSSCNGIFKNIQKALYYWAKNITLRGPM